MRIGPDIAEALEHPISVVFGKDDQVRRYHLHEARVAALEGAVRLALRIRGREEEEAEGGNERSIFVREGGRAKTLLKPVGIAAFRRSAIMWCRAGPGMATPHCGSGSKWSAVSVALTNNGSLRPKLNSVNARDQGEPGRASARRAPERPQASAEGLQCFFNLRDGSLILKPSTERGQCPVGLLPCRPSAVSGRHQCWAALGRSSRRPFLAHWRVRHPCGSIGSTFRQWRSELGSTRLPSGS